MSPLNGFGRYGPGRSLHHHHLHQPLSQDSFSGRSTPDNHSFVSLGRYTGEGLHSPDVPGEHDDVLDRLTPSEADSSYTRPPPSTVSGVPHSSRVWSYLQDHHQLMGSPRSPPALPGTYSGPSSPPSSAAHPPRLLRPNPFSAPQLHPHEFHHRRGMNMLTATTPDALPNGNALNDLDEELSSYHEHSSRRDPGYRRASLPVSSAVGMPVSHASPTTPTTTTANMTESSNKKWDFKYPARLRRGCRVKGSGGGNGHDVMGRMSPYTSSDMGRYTPTSPYLNHLEDLQHGHSVGPTVATDPVKKAGGRTRRSSSRSPVKLSSPVPIEPSPSHPYHHSPHAQSPHKPHPLPPHPDSYDEDDLDNGAKAASGGSRSGSKMSSSLGSRSDFDHEERQMTGPQVSSAQLRGGTDGGDRDRDRDNFYTSPEPSLPERSTTNRSSLRLNLSSMLAPLPPYEQNPPHTVHHSHHQQQQQNHQYQSLAMDQKLRSHSSRTTEDAERNNKSKLHSSGPSSPVRVTTASSSSLGHTQPDSQDSVDSENQISYEVHVPKLEFAHDVSPTHPVTSELGSSMAEASLTVQNGNSSSPRKKGTTSVHSNSSSAQQSKSESTNISPTGNISGNLTHKGPLTTTSSGLESPQRTTQGALSESALKSVEALNGIKQSISKAITFEQQLKALAESGSSDQDSDSEPYTSQGLTIPQHEQQKISDKMKTSVPPQQIMVRLMKPPSMSSFGFSVADGQYDQGVYVKAVKPGGPADGSDGLKSYDRIIKVRCCYC